jgi:hypothetical protein
MTEEVLFQKAMEKAQANGLILHFSYRQVYQQILNKKLPFWISRAFIFWIPFAQAFWRASEPTRKNRRALSKL